MLLRVSWAPSVGPIGLQTRWGMQLTLLHFKWAAVWLPFYTLSLLQSQGGHSALVWCGQQVQEQAGDAGAARKSKCSRKCRAGALWGHHPPKGARIPRISALDPILWWDGSVVCSQMPSRALNWSRVPLALNSLMNRVPFTDFSLPCFILLIPSLQIPGFPSTINSISYFLCQTLFEE